jgi:hypothetical protein
VFIRLLREANGLAQEGVVLGGEAGVHGYREGGGRWLTMSRFNALRTVRRAGPLME